MILSAIVKLNNLAVRLMQQGRCYDSAAKILTEAMRLMKKAVVGAPVTSKATERIVRSVLRQLFDDEGRHLFEAMDETAEDFLATPPIVLLDEQGTELKKGSAYQSSEKNIYLFHLRERENKPTKGLMSPRLSAARALPKRGRVTSHPNSSSLPKTQNALSVLLLHNHAQAHRLAAHNCVYSNVLSDRPNIPTLLAGSVKLLDLALDLMETTDSSVGTDLSSSALYNYLLQSHRDVNDEKLILSIVASCPR